MHPSQKKRFGVFNQYTKSDLNNYHISYHTNNPKKPNRPFAHLRKNKGFTTVQYGEKGIDANSKSIHKIRLVKKDNHISMFIDDREIINWKDDGLKYGEQLTGGKFAFRQMQWSHFRYRNFKVWNIN
jgi:hypothetical protein